MPLTRSAVAPPFAALDIDQSLGLPSATIMRGGAFLFVAGLTAIDPQTGKRVRGTAAGEAKQVLANLKAVLEAADSSLEKVVKVNVLLASMLEAPNVNEVFLRTFPDAPPARTVCGARLPDGVRIIIECTALA